MNPITRLLFLEIGPDRSGTELLRRMEELDARITPEGDSRYCFHYEDDGQISGHIHVSHAGEVTSISLALGLESDRPGWEGWSEKNEALRLRKQDEWLNARSLGNKGSGHGRILNHYSPQSGGSEISIHFGE
jgi:hypothetical protein